MTTGGTNSTTITADLPDFASDTIDFKLLSSVAISGTEIFPGKIYTMTLDVDGVGSLVIPTPDGTGDLAWLWEVNLPDGREENVSIAWSALSQDLATILAAAVSTTTPSDIAQLIINKVDRTGDTMTGDLTMTSANLVTPDNVQFNESYSPTGAEPTATMFWNGDDEEMNFVADDDGTISMGKEVYEKMTNLSGVEAVNGDVVSAIGATGNRQAFTLTDATDAASAAACIGMVTVPSIANNTPGRITKIGRVRGLNTSAFAEGAIVYVNPANPGKLTDVEPQAPNFNIAVGTVTVSHASVGVISLAIRIIPKMSELSDVNGTALTTSGQLLEWDQVNGYWDATANTSDFLAVANNLSDVASSATARENIELDQYIDGNQYRVQASIYKIGILSQLLSRLDSELVDFVGIGDSNQLLGGHGWDDGFQYALSQYYNMYATGLIAGLVNGGNGNAQGYKYSSSNGLVWASPTGAPVELQKYLNGYPGNNFQSYGYLDDADTSLNAYNGLAIDADCPVDVNANLKCKFHYGTFPAGTAAAVFFARRIDPPYTGLGSVAVNTVTGAYGLASADFTITASTKNYPIGVYWQQPGVTQDGPMFATYLYAQNTDRAAGFSYSTFIYRGGETMRTFAGDISTMAIDSTTHYFDIIRSRQGANKNVCVVINTGLNDRNETDTSVGQLSVTDGDSSLAYLDNAENIIKQLNQVWGANGWDKSELTFVLMVSHPIDDPDDSELISYRRAITNLCDAYANVCAVNLANITNETEMLANDWYASGGADRSHLSQAGYEQIALKVIDAAR